MKYLFQVEVDLAPTDPDGITAEDIKWHLLKCLCLDDEPKRVTVELVCKEAPNAD